MTSYPSSNEWDADSTRPGHGPQQGPQDHSPQPGSQSRYPGGTYPGRPDSSDRSMAMLAHLSTLIAMVISVGWLSIVGPLIMWFAFKDKSPFVRQAAAGAFNFGIGLWVAQLVGWILTVTLVGAVIGIPILIVAAVVTVVFPILGAVRANRGEPYDYPFKITVLT